MTNREFYVRLNNVVNTLRIQAFEMTNSMDAARQLYLETIFQAKRNSNKLKSGKDFEQWMNSIMVAVYKNTKFQA